MRSFIVAALVAASPAVAQESCAPLDQMAEILANGYGEQVISEGIAANGGLLQMWANPDTRTWTLVLVMPEGISCMIASGGDFNLMKPEPHV